MESMLVGLLSVIVLLLIGLVAKLAIKVGENQAGLASLDTKLVDLKTNDIAHVYEDTQALRMEIGALRNAIFSQMQEMILGVVGKIVGATCASATCPFVNKSQGDPE